MIEAIGDWLITVAGSAMLFGLFDMLLPSGSVRSFTRAVMGLVVMAIMLSPLIEWGSGTVEWPVESREWLVGDSGPTLRRSVDWDAAAALREAGRRVAIHAASTKWEREVERRLRALDGVREASITSVWGSAGPNEVRARVWLTASPRGRPADGGVAVSEPAPVNPVGAGVGVGSGSGARSTARGGAPVPLKRGPPDEGSEPTFKGAVPEPTRSEDVGGVALLMIQTLSGLPEGRIRLTVIEGE